MKARQNWERDPAVAGGGGGCFLHTRVCHVNRLLTLPEKIPGIVRGEVKHRPSGEMNGGGGKPAASTETHTQPDTLPPTGPGTVPLTPR